MSSLQQWASTGPQTDLTIHFSGLNCERTGKQDVISDHLFIYLFEVELHPDVDFSLGR